MRFLSLDRIRVSVKKLLKNFLIKNNFFRNFLPTFGIIVLLGGLILFDLIPKFETNLIEAKKEMIVELSNLAISLLSDYDERVQNGELSLLEAQERALSRIQELRYGPYDTDYFWNHNLEDIMIMHPYRTELNNQSIKEFKDPKGTQIFYEMNELVFESGDGFLAYQWQLREDPSQIEPKLSYVQLYEPWGWVIGTGLYITDVNQALAVARRSTYGAISLLLIVVAAWSYLINWRTSIAERKRKEALSALEENEAQLATLFDSAVQFIGLLSPEGKIIKINRTAMRFIGVSHKDIVNQYFWETAWFLPSQTMVQNIKKWIAQAAEGHLVHQESYTYGLSGQKLTMVASFKPIKNKQDQVTAIIVEGRDISNRKIAEEKIQRKLGQLDALHQIDLAINSGSNIVEVTGVIFDQFEKLFNFDAVSLWQYDPGSQILINVLDRGFRKSWQNARLRLGESFVGKVVEEKTTLFKNNRNWLSQPDMEFVVQENFVDFIGIPLIAYGEVEGVLEIFNRSEINLNSDEWHFVNVLAHQAAIALNNALLVANLQKTNIELRRAYDRTLEGWAKALELRDEETEGHSRRVTEMTIELAKQMGEPDEKLVHIRRGAILHDIGKMGIPDEILLKPGPLTADEWKIMKEHPVYAYKLLSPIPFLQDALDIPYYHHEWWNGEGYPRGLEKRQIPLAARIFAVIDVWDALSSDRPYRDAWPREKVLAYIRDLSGTQFDPEVVEHFLQIVQKYENN